MTGNENRIEFFALSHFAPFFNGEEGPIASFRGLLVFPPRPWSDTKEYH